MVIYIDEQTDEWKEEFRKLWKIQKLYGDNVPKDLWDELDIKAKLRKDQYSVLYLLQNIYYELQSYLNIGLNFINSYASITKEH